MDEMNKIVICKHCNKPEYFGEMRWKDGKCMCRCCYKILWESENYELYHWTDLDGKVPTMKEYKEQIVNETNTSN